MKGQTLATDPLIAAYFNETIEKKEADEAYTNLNNLYLEIQSGKVKLTRREYFLMDGWLNQMYRHTDEMHAWWWKEFSKLPGWLNV